MEEDELNIEYTHILKPWTNKSYLIQACTLD